jgi:protein-S-isoprenylcysteine O-methyltransferase Ste14
VRDDMSTLYILGTASFALFILYDLNQIRGNRKALKLLFPVGIVLLSVVSLRIALVSVVVYEIDHWLMILSGIIAAAFFVLLIYTLFFAVPFDSAYVQGSKQKLCTTGVYGICRHPGVLFLAGLYIFAALAMGKRDLLIAGVIFTVCNTVYVAIQDRWIFPRVFEGYEDYRRTTHFLLPLGHRA